MGKKHLSHCLGKKKSGLIHCYGRTTTPTTLKKNQEIDALKREHVIQINDMIKKFGGLEAVMKFELKQNTDLDVNDIEEMVARALGNESSVVASLPQLQLMFLMMIMMMMIRYTLEPSKIVKYFIQTLINLKKIMY